MFNFLSDPSVLLSTSAAVWLSGVGATRLGETDDDPLGERALKSDVALRFGPQLPPNAIDAQFDKINGAFIATEGLQNFASPKFSTPMIDAFSTLGQLALSFEEVQSVCVSRCPNNPDCKAVGVYGPRVGTCDCTSGEEGETKTPYSCTFINPDLGPGAYIAQEPEGYRDILEEPGVVYTKKAGNPTVVPSYDDVACNITTSTIVDDITCYYGCLNRNFNTNIAENPEFPNSCFYNCFIVNNGDQSECQSTCIAQCATDDCELTSDFRDYILPATGCLASFGAEVLDSCLTCLTSSAYSIASICTANDEQNFIRGLCHDECYEVPLTETNSTLDITSCEPMIQAAIICYNGANVGFAPNSTNVTAGGRVNRYDSATPFACP